MHLDRDLQVEAQSAADVKSTLARLFKYFKPYLLALILAALFLEWARGPR